MNDDPYQRDPCDCDLCKRGRAIAMIASFLEEPHCANLMAIYDSTMNQEAEDEMKIFCLEEKIKRLEKAGTDDE